MEKNKCEECGKDGKVDIHHKDFELSEQQYRQFDDFMQKLSHENTQEPKKGFMCNMVGIR